MMITLAEVKTFARITTTDYDNYITSIIPVLEQLVCEYCNNDFVSDTWKRYIISSNISFIASTNSININNIESYNLAVGDNLRIYGSLRNDGAYTIDNIGTSSITFNSINKIKDENAGESIVLARVTYPISIKSILAEMIKFKLSDYKIGLKSENIDDYGYSLDTLLGEYPKSLLAQLNPYRCVFNEKPSKWHPKN